MGSNATPQGVSRHSADSGHRADGACDVERSREGLGSGLRRLRYQADRITAAARKNPGVAHWGHARAGHRRRILVMTKQKLPMDSAPSHELSAALLHDLRTPLNHIVGY